MRRRSPAAGHSQLRPGETGTLELRDVHAYYGSAQALDGLTLTVDAGEVVGVVGLNGAGKSTMMRTVAGLHRRVTGTVDYGGVSLLGLKPDVVGALGITFVRDGAHVFQGLTIREHLVLAARAAKVRGNGAPGVDEVVDMFPVLKERGLQVKAGYLSGGQRQALGLAMAVGGGARCILFDEPSAGLAESTAAEIFGNIRRFVDGGISLLIAEQDVRWLQGLCDRIVELEMGRILGPLATDGSDPRP
jgi:branched-chain amino acid transport system ATP-binding protein